jgi:UDP-N-acetylmuramyl pentapeptide phosphotransferase/UDP-N-acetylglucosamine-1-phosphate transferase
VGFILGDVGSLPIGLLLGWCLLQLAYSQQLAAALLLPHCRCRYRRMRP